MMRALVVLSSLVMLTAAAPPSRAHAAARPSGGGVTCCLEASVDDAPPHRFCFNLRMVRARPRRARKRARIVCRLIGGTPQPRRVSR